MSRIKLFHTGFQIIEKPDLRIGRKNADFGQGFYLSEDKEFSRRWAQQRKGLTTYLNSYELELEGLKVRYFERDVEWFDYIFSNRRGHTDPDEDIDVIIGPIANDTIYDTWGILTSGLIDRDQALRIMLIGNAYEQTVIKTERALGSLHFLEATEITADEISAYRDAVQEEERQFQEKLAELMEELPED